MQYRALRPECGGDTGHCIGASRARSGNHATELASLPGIPVGSVGRRLFVANVYDPDPFIQATIVDIDYVSTTEGENSIDAFCF
jgi:hypothetical protein